MPMKYLCVLFAVLTSVLPFSCARKEDTGKIVYSELRSVNKVVLAQMSITKMATLEDLDPQKAVGLRQTGAALLDAVKIGARRAAYSYDTYMRAYVDMNEFSHEDVRVDESAKHIYITLPAVRTEFAGRDASVREDHYRVTGLRSQIDPAERADLKEKMNSALKKEVEENPVFREKLAKSARTKGKSYFSALASREGYTVTVNFCDEKGGDL